MFHDMCVHLTFLDMENPKNQSQSFSELFRFTDRVLRERKVLTGEVGTTPVIKIITYIPLSIFTICFTICLFISPDLDGHRAPKIFKLEQWNKKPP